MNANDVSVLTGNREKLKHQLRRAAKFGPRNNRRKLRRVWMKTLAGK